MSPQYLNLARHYVETTMCKVRPEIIANVSPIRKAKSRASRRGRDTMLKRLHRCGPFCGDQKVGTSRARRLAAAACAAAPCDCAPDCEKRFVIRICVRCRRPFECSQSSACVGADSLFKRSPNAAALCSARLESHACMSRAAASWLGIISVGVLPMAGSASTMLDARIDAF